MDKVEGFGEVRRSAVLFEPRAERRGPGSVGGRLMGSIVLGCDTDRRVGMAEALEWG